MKLLHAGIILLCVVMLTGCGGGDGVVTTPAQAALVGHWVAVSVSDGFETISTSEAGVSMEVFFFSDLTYDLRGAVAGGGVDIMTGTWTAEGSQVYFTTAGMTDTVPYMQSGNSMSLFFAFPESSIWVNFVRQ